MRILTWHVHGSYLLYLSHLPHELIVPFKDARPDGYGGRAGSFPWPDNVVEVPVEQVASLDVDLVLYQSHRNWLVDQHEILSDAQRSGPRIYLEHDPPRRSPTDTVHPVDDPRVLIVHVTAFNDLMWDCGRTPTTVVDHGVVVPQHVEWTGELERGLVVVNGIVPRGRRLGLDVFLRVREEIPLDLAGMGSEELGGLGDLPLAELHERACRYRFLFNPIRYTSMGLAVCEAMMLGLPVVGLATTEMATAIRNDVNGYADTDVDVLVARMRALLDDHTLAARLSAGARALARERFGIDRFVADWDRALAAALALAEEHREAVAEA